jgi:DNA-binding transcriptional LysR family regulator
MEAPMELRHLRYFVAVAEAGSLTVAAEKKAAHGAAVPQSPNPRSRI